MVVEAQNAIVTKLTMLGTRWSVDIASQAILLLHSLVIDAQIPVRRIATKIKMMFEFPRALGTSWNDAWVAERRHKEGS